ncbi:hypothetical protein [Halomonas daqiaonensis]|uniref:hypothetical protein n=1 Tax=Halomonas daqiaonensis TaxID=650850 RepID=UPI001B8D4F07|nr:hypothetical protein [Halomonas daqiaonensis]
MTSSIRQISLDTATLHHSHVPHQILIGLIGKTCLIDDPHFFPGRATGGSSSSSRDRKPGVNYLLRFATERARIINTADNEGNASLLSLGTGKVEGRFALAAVRNENWTIGGE